MRTLLKLPRGLTRLLNPEALQVSTHHAASDCSAPDCLSVPFTSAGGMISILTLVSFAASLTFWPSFDRKRQLVFGDDDLNARLFLLSTSSESAWRAIKRPQRSSGCRLNTERYRSFPPEFRPRRSECGSPAIRHAPPRGQYCYRSIEPPPSYQSRPRERYFGSGRCLPGSLAPLFSNSLSRNSRSARDTTTWGPRPVERRRR